MIHELAKLDRAIKFQYGRVQKTNGRNHIHVLNLLNIYLTEYVNFYKLSLDETLKRYYTFVNRYVDDLKVFEKNGLFPFQNKNSHVFDIPRSTYDIFLILSSLLQKHRFQIMKNIYEAETGSGSCLVVGVGSGLELVLLRNKFKNIDAYDLSISNFCKHKFNDLNLYEKKFSPRFKRKYDAIYAIELLEHLECPYEILSNFSQSLKKNGRLIVTTIKNVPQFDHLYNFSNEYEFEKHTRNLGFYILHKEVIKHNYVFFKVDTNNCFYILEKNILDALNQELYSKGL